MRGPGLIFIIVATGCTEYRVVVSPDFDDPLGLFLTAEVYTHVERCSPDGFDEETCTTVQDTVRVDLDSGGVLLGEVPPEDLSDFTVTGVEVGDVTMQLSGDVTYAEVVIRVRPVLETRLLIERCCAPIDVPLGEGQAFAYTGEELVLDQRHRTTGGEVLIGESPWDLDPGATTATVEPYSILATGTRPGRAVLDTPVGGELVIDVVDETAMATMEIVKPFSSEPAMPLEITLGPTYEVYLVASDAAGNPIIGRGPEPVITVPAPQLAEVRVSDDWLDDVRVIEVEGLGPGTTVADISWGPLTAQLEIEISP